jgi:hypothetical protein
MLSLFPYFLCGSRQGELMSLFHHSVTTPYEVQTEVVSTSIFIIEELNFVKSVKKFPACYTTRRFTTVFTSARYWSLRLAK